MEKTQIRIDVDTRDKLKDVKVHKRETYDDIINRLIDEKKEK